MRARTYLSLFRWIDWAVLAFLVLATHLSAIIATLFTRTGADPFNPLAALVMLPLFAGLFIAHVWRRTLALPPVALLPGIHRSLLRWNGFVLLVFAAVNSLLLHLMLPKMHGAMLASAVAMVLTVRLPYGRAGKGSELGMLILVFTAALTSLVAIRNAGSLTGAIVTHPWLTTAACLLVTAANVALAIRRLGRPGGRDIAGRRNPGKSFRRAANASRPVYEARGGSLLRWTAAVFQETPGGAFTMFLGHFTVLFFMPKFGLVAARQPAWYDTVFGNSWGDGRMVVLVCWLILLAVRPGSLRTERLYPLARRRRSQIAFVAALISSAVSFAIVAGGSLIAGRISASWNGLPADPSHAAVFLIRLGLVLALIPFLRWGVHHISLRRDFVSVVGFAGLACCLFIAGQFLILNWGITAGAVFCVALIVASHLLYFAALRRFYATGDLIRRSATLLDPRIS